MPELQIIGGPQSNYVWVARIACAEKGVPYTLVPVMPHTPEVDAIHPFGKIPVMRHGDVTLCESARDLLLHRPRVRRPATWCPRDPVEERRPKSGSRSSTRHIDPLLVRQYLGAYFFPRTPGRPPQSRGHRRRRCPRWKQHFAVLDRAVAKTGHLVGDSFTLADMNLLPILFYIDKAPESRAMLRPEQEPQARIIERHQARTSVKDTIPPPFPGRSSWEIEG